MTTFRAIAPADDGAAAAILRWERLIWAIIGGMFVVAVLAYLIAGLSIDIRSCLLVAGLWLGCVAIGAFYRYVRCDWRISFGAVCTAQVLAILVLAALVTYPAATAAFPYRDGDLAAADRFLGLDWRAYLAFVDGNPVVAEALRLGYGSMQPQFAVVIGVLTMTGHFARAQRYAIALAVALAVAIPIFTLMPAVAAYAHFGLTPADFPHIRPAVPYAHIGHLEAMRNGTRTVISMDNLEGIITFPSFHTTAAILFTWALWPAVRLRWIVVSLNFLLIAGAPIEGAHYFIDLLGGAAVALFAVLAATSLQERISQAAPRRPGLARTEEAMSGPGTHGNPRDGGQVRPPTPGRPSAIIDDDGAGLRSV